LANAKGGFDMARKIKWKQRVDSDDCHSAAKYLVLLFTKKTAIALAGKLTKAPVVEFDAKDILRASQTHLLDKKNFNVRKELRKIEKGEAMAPVLLVRGDAQNGVTLTIADGYHRICAAWHWDEEAPIRCCLVDLPPG
jgi:hypothetical protein